MVKPTFESDAIVEYGKKEGKIEGIAQGFQIFLEQGMEFEKIAGLYKLSEETARKVRRFLEASGGY